jgi:hypothetical protein
LRPSWQAERRRIEGLELLDELEEWVLLQVCGHWGASVRMEPMRVWHVHPYCCDCVWRLSTGYIYSATLC